MKNIYLFPILLLTVFFSSCMEEVDYLKSNLAQKPVVNCFFSTDSTFKVYVGLTTEIFSEESDSVPDASVIVYSEQGDTIVFNKKSKYLFESDSVAKKGVLYHLLVQSSLFDDVTAQNTIPSGIITIDTVIYKKESYYDDSQNMVFSELQVDFWDINNVDNYYEISVQTKSLLIDEIEHPLDTTYYFKKATNFNSDNPLIEKQNDGMKYQDYLLFSDVKFSDDNLVLNMTLNLFDLNRDKIVVIIKNVSYDYFVYRRSVVLHERSNDFGSFSEWSNMMFVTKNIPIYGNIIGGKGVFAGYNSDSEYSFYISDFNQNF